MYYNDTVKCKQNTLSRNIHIEKYFDYSACRNENLQNSMKDTVGF